jgi:hypothetical protein
LIYNHYMSLSVYLVPISCVSNVCVRASNQLKCQALSQLYIMSPL